MVSINIPLQRFRMNDNTLQMTMLFDFFGDLLTEKQREYFDLYHNEDLSLSEIAEKAGISRQGVHDLVTRAEKTLVETELKTGVIRRWRETSEGLEQAERLARELLSLTEDNEAAAELGNRLVGILEELRGI